MGSLVQLSANGGQATLSYWVPSLHIAKTCSPYRGDSASPSRYEMLTQHASMTPANGAGSPSAVEHLHNTSVNTTAVPEVRLVSIDHPCIVRNFDTGFTSLGGEQQIKHALEDDSEQDTRPRKAQRSDASGAVLGLSLRPHDPLATKLISSPTETHNLLVKVAVPKWTGRKRKRGTDEPFVADSMDKPKHGISAPGLLQRLRDNAGKYKAEAIGKIETTHRFNSLPDLQIQNGEVPVMRELSQHATRPDYDILKKFHVDLNPGTEGITALPRPPDFIPPDMDATDPFDPQIVAQNFTSRVLASRPAETAAEGNLEDSAQRAAKPVPKPIPRYTPGAPIPDMIKTAIESLKTFFDNRPIATGTVLSNCLPGIPRYKLDAAITWIGPKFKDGPWKDCVIRRDVDPTSDPEYRKYQIVAVRPHVSSKGDGGSHIFNGREKLKGRGYQLCDITDPVLAQLISTPTFRSKEEGYGGPACGWYYNGTVAKIRILMSEKLKRMHTPGATMLDEQVIAAVAALPEKIDESTSCDLDANVHGEDARFMAVLIKKEALKLAAGRGEKETGPGEKEEDGATPWPVQDMIDPALMGHGYQWQGDDIGEQSQQAPDIGGQGSIEQAAATDGMT